jgi:hypothetical protein
MPFMFRIVFVARLSPLSTASCQLVGDVANNSVIRMTDMYIRPQDVFEDIKDFSELPAVELLKFLSTISTCFPYFQYTAFFG